MIAIHFGREVMDVLQELVKEFRRFNDIREKELEVLTTPTPEILPTWPETPEE